jgi:hypothetical protein
MSTVVEFPRLQPHFDDLTTGSVDGKGLFDELMRSVKAHLDHEYKEQRIRGADYTQAYIASMQAALGNAVQYLIGIRLLDAELKKLEADTQISIVEKARIETQTELLEAQIDQTEAQTIQIGEQTKLTVAQTEQVEAKTNQIPLENDQLIAQTAQIEAKTAQIPLENDQLVAQTAQTEAQTTLITAQKNTEEATREPKVDQLVAATDKTKTDKDLVSEEIAKAEYTLQFLLPGEREMLENQILKTQSERDLIFAKASNEGKQGIVLDKQSALIAEQALAYDKEIAVKYAKIRADAWSSKAVVSEDVTTGPTIWQVAGQDW